jgi:hypothetical protein
MIDQIPEITIMKFGAALRTACSRLDKCKVIYYSRKKKTSLEGSNFPGSFSQQHFIQEIPLTKLSRISAAIMYINAPQKFDVTHPFES